MNHTMNAALTTKSAAELETAFAQLAKLEPPGFPQWSTLAQTGKDAAARADFSAVKRVCSACHEQYRPLYRKEMRARPLTLASPP
jgi:hypothetical protein